MMRNHFEDGVTLRKESHSTHDTQKTSLHSIMCPPQEVSYNAEMPLLRLMWHGTSTGKTNQTRFLTLKQRLFIELCVPLKRSLTYCR